MPFDADGNWTQGPGFQIQGDQFGGGGIPADLVGGGVTGKFPTGQGVNWWDQNGLGHLPTDSAGPTAEDPYAGGDRSAMPASGQASFGDLSSPAAWMALVRNPQQLKSWVRQNNPGISDDLANYYVTKIQGQPGANAAEQAGGAQYWTQKMQGGGVEGAGGGGFSGGFGGGGQGPSGLYNPNDLTAGFTDAFKAPSGAPGANPFTDTFSAPTAEQAAATPGYQFALSQGLQGIDRGAASKGTLLTMGNQKDRAQFAEGLASQTYGDTYNRAAQEYANKFNIHTSNAQDAQSAYGNSYNRAMQEYLNSYNIFNSNQGNLFNRNYQLAGLGLSAAGGQAGAASNIGTAGNTAATNTGNAQAAGSLTKGNNNAGIATSLGELGTTLAKNYLTQAA